jgi:hypothetical protein
MKINISFNLNGNIIKTEDEVKLLGVTIDNLTQKLCLCAVFFFDCDTGSG